MSDLIEDEPSKSRSNPLFWIILIVIGLIIYIVTGVDRGNPVSGKAEKNNEREPSELSGEIDRNLLVPPGMRARQYVKQIRAKGPPYPLVSVFDRANEYHNEGNLADAHLLYFFAAREGYAESMIKMAEMSDPNLFRAEDSLLDHADALQSYKWYQKVAEQGQVDVNGRIQKLQQWAQQESELDNPHARQLLLVLQ